MAPQRRHRTNQEPQQRKRTTIPSRVQNSLSLGHFWKAKSKMGRNPIFANPQQLLDSCIEYFEWIANNPIQQEKIVGISQGEVLKEVINHPHAMTIGGLCLFLDICPETWTNYRNDEAFLGVCRYVENAIRQQKFAGASVGLFNHAIIARDLGLADRQDVTSNGKEIQGGVVIILPAKEATE